MREPCLFTAPTVRAPRPMAHCSSAARHGLTDGFLVTRFMLFEQSVANQKRDAAFANFDRRAHGHAP